jgi:hypothetical protein
LFGLNAALIVVAAGLIGTLLLFAHVGGREPKREELR